MGLSRNEFRDLFERQRDPLYRYLYRLTGNRADAEDLLWADGVIFGTPENFGYMSGALKDFFDRTFYPCEGKTEGLPIAIFIGCGNDGTGALNAIRRITPGYRFREVAEPVIVRGELDEVGFRDTVWEPFLAGNAFAAPPRGIPVNAGDQVTSGVQPALDEDVFVFDAFAGGTYDVPACIAHLATGPVDCRRGCLARGDGHVGIAEAVGCQTQ